MRDISEISDRSWKARTKETSPHDWIQSFARFGNQRRVPLGLNSVISTEIHYPFSFLSNCNGKGYFTGLCPIYLHQCIVAHTVILLAFSASRKCVLRCFTLTESGGDVVKLWFLNVTKLTCMLILVSVCVGCNSTTSEDQRRRDDKTREEAAKATERIKPELKEAGKELGQAAREAAEDARAAAQGVKEGWSRDHTHPLDLNTATESDLQSLPGITKTDAERIIRNRPYRSKSELFTKRILSETEYDQIRDYVTAD